MGYRWDFSFLPSYFQNLWSGVLVTLELSVLTIFFATLIGIAVGIAASRKNRILRFVTITLIDVIRSVPILVLILWVYYLFPFVGLHTDAFVPAVVALIINNCVFIGDLVRGGIEGVPRGAAIAGRALGMNRSIVLRRIVLPEVCREIFPALTLMYISIVKLTSLASVIAVYEVTHIGDWIISTTYKPLEVYTVIAGIYLVIIFPLTVGSRLLEKSRYFKRRSL